MRTARIALALVLALMLVGAAVPAARAERLIMSLSTHLVQIRSNFAGAELLLFGGIERDAATVTRRGGYDLVVTVKGPPETVVTRRKERVVGIWVNTDSRTFLEAPGYLAVLTNRTSGLIADPLVRRRQQIGLNNIVLPQMIGEDVADVTSTDPFRSAFIRLRTAQGLYREQANAVTFLTPTLFRATIPLPAIVPTGTFDVEAKLFADGTLLARQASAIEVVKVGFEQFVAHAARDQGLLYGLATVAIALLTGWLGAVIFRRD